MKIDWKSFLLCKLFFTYIFFASGLIINFFMLIVYIVVWPLSRKYYRMIIYYLAYALWSEFTFIAQWWSGSQVILYMNPEDRHYVGQEHCLVLMNHKYDIDWLIGWVLTERFGMLGGSKVFVKKGLALVPIIGWAWHFTETIFLRRQWAQDRQIIQRDLAEITDYPPGYSVNILLFPEGTRFTKSKLEESNKIAVSKGLTEMKHCLLPRTKGFVQAVHGVRGKVSALYDCTIAFESSCLGNEESQPSDAPSLWKVFEGKPYVAHFYCRRIPMEDIPTDDQQCAQWLFDSFKEKDSIYDRFLHTKQFPGEALIPPRRARDLIVYLFWSLLLSIPLFMLVCYLCFHASLATNCVAFLTTFISLLLLKMMIGVTEINRGSDYGMNSKAE